METLQNPLAKELEQEKKKNDIIRRLSVELSHLSTLKEKLDNILEMLDQSFGLKHSMLLLPDQEHEYLRVFASRGFDDHGLGTQVKMGEGVIGVVALRKRKLRMTNISRQRHYLQASAATQAGVKVYSLPALKQVESQVAIPLLANDELVAVLSAESTDVNFFSREDEDFLMTLSQLLAISIQNAIILEQLEQKVQERTAALEAKKQELEQLNASKDRLFSIIGHDLRSPAAALQNVTDLIRYYQEKGDLLQLNNLGCRISRAANNISYMLDNLLNWSITQTGDLQLKIEALPVQELIEEVLEMYQEMIWSKNISICFTCPEDLLLMADRNAALTILRNLLCNSVKFTPQGGKVEIRAQQQGDHTHITISDNGVGMEPEKLKYLFCLREGKSTKGTAKEKGVGLGMILVREFIRLNNGSIKVSSLPQQGTTIELLFPAL
ncbi:GAF domain-containing sensor histidine kinase [Cesiribacter sp. SM1]|uniref:GAF domain-containing sensor histidine kinase n=1 Tax=Cesiribacter sp. SM1 TaxID=2861196 RepID=UPI001CD4CA64|nr:GAF domain-containing sensor histidine kinase [Cesiribacter sp. SM1]